MVIEDQCLNVAAARGGAAILQATSRVQGTMAPKKPGVSLRAPIRGAQISHGEALMAGANPMRQGHLLAGASFQELPIGPGTCKDLQRRRER